MQDPNFLHAHSYAFAYKDTTYHLKIGVHRQNVEVTNAESKKHLATKRQMGQNAEWQNVEW
jgi:hypothetical protein